MMTGFAFLFVTLACAALAVWIWVPKAQGSPQWSRLLRWPAIIALALFLGFAFYSDLSAATPTGPVSLAMGLAAWLVLRQIMPNGAGGVRLSVAPVFIAAPFGTEFEDWQAMIPPIDDAVSAGQNMVAAGASPWQSIIIVAGVPVFAMVWRTLHNFVQPYVDRHTAKLRLRDANEALAEEMKIRQAFDQGAHRDAENI